MIRCICQHFTCRHSEDDAHLIPDKYGASFVSHSASKVLPSGNVVVEEAQEVVGLLLVKANDVSGVYRVDVWAVSLAGSK